MSRPAADQAPTHERALEDRPHDDTADLSPLQAALRAAAEEHAVEALEVDRTVALGGAW